MKILLKKAVLALTAATLLMAPAFLCRRTRGHYRLSRNLQSVEMEDR